jgi:hypothetical protein
MNKIKVGFIGTGYMATEYAKVFKKIKKPKIKLIGAINKSGLNIDKFLNLHKIRSIGYLKETISWNEDSNFDRVSAMGMLMILREEYKKYKLQVNEQTLGNKIKNLSNDPFFDMNYNMKGKIDPKILKAFGANSYNVIAEIK